MLLKYFCFIILHFCKILNIFLEFVQNIFRKGNGGADLWQKKIIKIIQKIIRITIIATITTIMKDQKTDKVKYLKSRLFKRFLSRNVSKVCPFFLYTIPLLNLCFYIS